MLKKLAVVLLLCMAVSGYAQMTPNKQQRQAMSQAVEQSLFASTTMRMNALYISQPFGHRLSMEDVRELPLEQIKVYNTFSPTINQCIVNSLNKKSYQQTLKKGLDHYFKQVTADEFKRDLAYLTEPKRVAHFAYTKQYMNLLAKHAAVLEKYFEEDVETDATKAALAQLEKLREQQPADGSFSLHASMDELMRDHGRFESMADLMGLSIKNIPNESLPNHVAVTINPMSFYQQTLIDDCHKPFWQSIKQGKYSGGFSPFNN